MNGKSKYGKYIQQNKANYICSNKVIKNIKSTHLSHFIAVVCIKHVNL